MENPISPIGETTEQQVEQPSDRPGRVIWDYLVLILVAGTIIFLDTWTKQLVDQNIPVGGAWLPEGMSQFLKHFRVTHLHNPGVAFSFLKDWDHSNLAISILAAVVALVIVVIYPRIDRKERVLRIAILLQLGGTIGNLISRIQFGYVLDFISVGSFAVFNIADSSLVVGAALMIIAVLVEEVREARTRREVDAAEDEIEPQMNIDESGLGKSD